MKSLPPHYLAFRVVLVIALCALVAGAVIWFVTGLPYLVRGLGGRL